MKVSSVLDVARSLFRPRPSAGAPPRLGGFLEVDAAGRPDGAHFAVWSTRAAKAGRKDAGVSVVFYANPEREVRRLQMNRGPGGLFTLRVADVHEGDLYKFSIDGQVFPDPYARSLPFGVHGPARLESPAYRWKHEARGLSEDPILYELHVGTFTPEGTLTAAIGKLGQLVDLGVDTLELMPLAPFDGQHGWGYDGVAAFAVHAPYGTSDELRGFVDEAHARGLSVVLDVVYNHFGPSGSYLSVYSDEYFAKDGTGWGAAPDLGCPWYRRLVRESVRMWFDDYRVDGLRLDATHAYRGDHPRDESPGGGTTIIAELVEEGALRTPARAIFCEDERNLAALVSRDHVRGIWADDFHHQLRVTQTGEREGYYSAYTPGVQDLARTITHGWLYEGQMYPPNKHSRGTSAAALEPGNFVYCIENHDQIGNRAHGDRLTESVSLEAFRAATLLLLALPMTPLLFMGQEWGASTPFLFFTDHEPELGAKIIEGRRSEFKGFAAFDHPEALVRIPSPQAKETFLRSKLDWSERDREPHRGIVGMVWGAIELRRRDPVLRYRTRTSLEARTHGELLVVTRHHGSEMRRIVFNPTKGAQPLGDLGGKVIFASDLRPVDGGMIPAEMTVIVSG